MEDSKNKKVVQPEKNNSTSTKDFSISDNDTFWTLNGVSHRNRSHQVNLLKSLLEDGESKTQDEWIKFAKSAMKNKEFYTPSMDLVYSIIRTTYLNKDNQKYQNEILQVKDFLKTSATNNYLITTTRLKYQPQGKDKIIHNYKLSNQYEIQENIVGSDDCIHQLQNVNKTLDALLGSDNPQEINNTFNWIFGVNTYLWRVNSTPKEEDERVARFSAGSGWVDLSCNWVPADSSSSLGVRAKQVRP